MTQDWLLQNGSLEVSTTVYASGSRLFGPLFVENETGGRGKQTCQIFLSQLILGRGSSTLTQKLWGLGSIVFSKITPSSLSTQTLCLAWSKCSVNIYWIKWIEDNSSIFSKKLKMLFCLLFFQSIEDHFINTYEHLCHFCSVLAPLRHPSLDSVPW